VMIVHDQDHGHDHDGAGDRALSGSEPSPQR
jgi:hypothetical protein